MVRGSTEYPGHPVVLAIVDETCPNQVPRWGSQKWWVFILLLIPHLLAGIFL